MSKWCNPLDGYFMRRQQEQLEKEGVKTIMNADITTRDTIPSNNLNDIFTCQCATTTSIGDLQPSSRTYTAYINSANGYIPKEYTFDSSDGFIVDNTIIPKHIARARRLREEEKKARSEKRRLEQEHKRQERERFVRLHMDEMRAKREAHRRLDEEGH